VVCALESTGSFAVPLMNFLLECGFHVVQVSTKAAKANRGTRETSFDKNDRQDARNILDLVFQAKVKYAHAPTSEEKEMRVLLKVLESARAELRAVKTKLRNNYLAEVFPELDSLYSDILHPDVVKVLREFGRPAAIRQVSLEEFLSRVGGKDKGKDKRSVAKLKLVWEKAQESIGVDACEAHLQMLKHLLDKGEALQAEIAELEDELVKVCDPSVYVLGMSVPGIGALIAAVLIGYIGCVGRFKVADQLLKFFGMSLAQIQSGERTGHIGLCKAGHAIPRWRMHQAARAAVRHHPEFARWFELEVAKRGGSKDAERIALTKIACKLVRILYGVLKSGRPYDRQMVVDRVNKLIEQHNSRLELGRVELVV